MSGAYITFRGKEVVTGWPATMIVIVLMYVSFCLLVAISALATYAMLSAISWVLS